MVAAKGILVGRGADNRLLHVSRCRLLLRLPETMDIRQRTRKDATINRVLPCFHGATGAKVTGCQGPSETSDATPTMSAE